MKKYLDILSNDIKLAEEYLFHYPITEPTGYSIEKNTKLSFKGNRLCLEVYDMVEGTTSIKPLIECSAKDRIDTYPYLPQFIWFCIKEQERLLDMGVFNVTHKELEDIFKNKKTPLSWNSREPDEQKNNKGCYVVSQRTYHYD